MLCTTLPPLVGEQIYIADTACTFPTAGVSLLYEQSGDKRRTVLVPASLSLSSYRLVVSPLRCSSERTAHDAFPLDGCLAPPPDPIVMPIFAIEKFGITVDTSSALVESFARARHALRHHLALFTQHEKARQRAQESASATARNGTHAHAVTAESSPMASEAPADARSFLVLNIQGKHVWSLKLLFPSGDHSQRILNTFKNILASETRGQQGCLEALPAFAVHEHKLAREVEYAHTYVRETAQTPCCTAASVTRMHTVEFGWNLYDPAVEAARQMCTAAAFSKGVVTDGALARPGYDVRPLFHWLPLTGDATQYTCSPTYPRQVLEPCAVDCALLEMGTKARGRARVPAIVFVHLGTGAVLARASQPLSRSPHVLDDAQICRALIRDRFGTRPQAQSQRLGEGRGKITRDAPGHPAVPGARPTASLFDDDDRVPLIGAPQPTPASPVIANTEDRQENVSDGDAASLRKPSSDRLFVADCRPWAAAKANAQLGGGCENGSAYAFCDTTFFGIENIFAVAASFQKLRALLDSFDGNQPDEGFHRRLHDTQWLAHIQRVLIASVKIVEMLDRAGGTSCLVHCTDGWDRTSQCTAAAQLLLDPFYRTTIGFCILMEKEFGVFGHKFAERSAHQRRGHTFFTTSAGVSGSDTEKTHELQASPVWVQFMDVVYQIWHQFRDDFEFTPALLEYLSVVVYGAVHGTFLCNCAQERELEGVRLRTSSVWTDVVRRVQAEKRGELPVCFLNTSYSAERAWACIRQRPHPHSSAPRTADPQKVPEAATFGCRTDGLDPLFFNCNSKRMTLWENLYFRHDSDNIVQPQRRCSASSFMSRFTISTEMVMGSCLPPTFTPSSSSNCVAGVGDTRGQKDWRVSFEDCLQGYIDHACQRRLDELEWLQALEARRSRGYVPIAQESTWGVFDPDVCFACYRPSSSWGGLKKRPVCEVCGQTFCSQCFTQHECLPPPGRTPASSST